MAAYILFTAVFTSVPANCAAAALRLPPPPTFSMMSCTFSSPIERAEANDPPFPSGATTMDASTPEMFSSSSAAEAATTRFCGSSGTAMARLR